MPPLREPHFHALPYLREQELAFRCVSPCNQKHAGILIERFGTIGTAIAQVRNRHAAITPSLSANVGSRASQLAGVRMMVMTRPLMCLRACNLKPKNQPCEVLPK